MDEMKYIWTQQDIEIAAGDVAKSMQGPFVTPYGIGPKPEHKKLGLKDPYSVRFEDSAMPWRATRFYKDSIDPNRTTHYSYAFDWVRLEIPSGITKIGELCKYLREKGYSDIAYDAKRLKIDDPGGMKMVNSAQMLFDFIGNSPYRFEASTDASVWLTYQNNPADLPVVANGIKLAYVLQQSSVVPNLSIAPDQSHATSIDTLDSTVDAFITETLRHAKNAMAAIELTNRTLSRRLGLVARLNAIAAIAESTKSNRDGSPNADALLAMLGAKDDEGSDKIIPTAHTALVAFPVTQHKSLSQALTEHTFDTDFRVNAADQMMDAGKELAKLIHGKNNEYHKTFTEWAANAVPILNTAETTRAAGLDFSTLTVDGGKSPFKDFSLLPPAFADRLNRLTHAMAWGHMALGQCGIGEGSDDPLADVEALPIERAKKADDAKKGDSVGEIIWNLLGSPATIVNVGMGNLAGPHTLHVAYRLRKIAKGVSNLVAKNDATEMGAFARRALNLIPPELHSPAVKRQVADLAKAVFERDKEELKKLKRGVELVQMRFAKFHSAGALLIENDKGEILKLERAEQEAASLPAEIAETAMGKAHRTLFKNALFTGIQVICTLEAASRAKKDASDGKETTLVVFDWVAFGGGVGLSAVDLTDTALEKFVAGWVEEHLELGPPTKFVARLVSAQKLLTKLGNAFGLITAIAGVVQGWYDFKEAWHRKEYVDMLVAGLGIAGSLAFVAVNCATVFFGATATTCPWLVPVEIIGTALVIAGASLALGKNLIGELSPGAKGVMKAISSGLHERSENHEPSRGDPVFIIVENENPDLKTRMDDMDKFVDENPFPNGTDDEQTKAMLRAAGLTDDVIFEITSPPPAEVLGLPPGFLSPG